MAPQRTIGGAGRRGRLWIVQRDATRSSDRIAGAGAQSSIGRCGSFETCRKKNDLPASTRNR